MVYKTEQQKEKSVFLWQTNLLRFYLQNDLEKAISLGEDIIEEQGISLDNDRLSDVKFNLATAIALRGDEDDLKQVITLYNEALEISSPAFAPFILNNLGMAHFFDFVLNNREQNAVKEDGPLDL